jgi:hypothetical protein
MWSIRRRCASISSGSVHPATSPVNAVRTQSEDWRATRQQQTETDWRYQHIPSSIRAFGPAYDHLPGPHDTSVPCTKQNRQTNRIGDQHTMPPIFSQGGLMWMATRCSEQTTYHNQHCVLYHSVPGAGAEWQPTTTAVAQKQCSTQYPLLS